MSAFAPRRALAALRRGQAWLLSLMVVPLRPARSTAAIVRDAMRSANAAHGYPLALREADAIAAAALRRALQHGA